MIRPNLSRIVTFPPGGGLGLSLSHIAHVSAPVYSYACPGGCDQLTATVYKPPRVRTEAFNPGRTALVYRGGSVVWSGIVDEPTPSNQGWQFTAHGAGAFGTDYVAIYTTSWGTGVFDNAVDQAIGRGLNWVRPATLAASGIWTGQQVDSGGQTITDLLNLGATKGGLTWQVVTGPGGRNVVSMFALPTVANRLLIATSPEAQSIASGPDAIYLRYQNSADGATTATYATTSVTSTAMINATGRREDYTDLSSAGTLTSGAAQAVGNSVLQRFQNAGFTDPFTIQYGELTNLGGVPVDPGVFYQDSAQVMVCRALLSDFAFAGQVTRGPVTFLVGAYSWDDGACQATITPFGAIRHDFSSLMQAAVNAIPVRAQPTQKKKKGK